MLNGWAPAVVIPGALLTWIYLVGVLKLRARSHTSGPASLWRVGAILSGGAVAVLATGSPLDAWAGTSFTFHMVQHITLMVIASPLLALGTGLGPFWAGLPQSVRSDFVGVVRKLSVLRWRNWWLPVVVVANTVALWVWHIPSAWEAALRSEVVHAAEHMTLLVASIALWMIVVESTRTNPLKVVLALFATALQGGVLAALISFSTQVWYPMQYRRPILQLDPLTDQRLAGAVMWAVPSVVYVAAALAVFASGLRRASTGYDTRQEVTNHGRQQEKL